MALQLKRIVALLVVVVVAIAALNWYSKHVTPYKPGEIVEVHIQLCGMRKSCIVVRNPDQIESIIGALELEKVEPRIEPCSGCEIVAFVGEGYTDVAPVQCGKIYLGIKGAPSEPYLVPEEFVSLVRSYRDSLELVEECESLYSQMEIERKQLK